MIPTICMTVLLTLACSDDRLVWDPVTDAVTYHIAGHGWDDLGPFVRWDADIPATMTEFPVGCVAESQWISVQAVDAAGNAGEAREAQFYWTAGDGRMLDDRNTDGRWVGEHMCGVAP